MGEGGWGSLKIGGCVVAWSRPHAAQPLTARPSSGRGCVPLRCQRPLAAPHPPSTVSPCMPASPPSHAGLVFTPVTVPLLRSEYGKARPCSFPVSAVCLPPARPPSPPACGWISCSIFHPTELHSNLQEFDYEAPVKLLDKMLHAQAENMTQQVRLLGLMCLRLFGLHPSARLALWKRQRWAGAASHGSAPPACARLCRGRAPGACAARPAAGRRRHVRCYGLLAQPITGWPSDPPPPRLPRLPRLRCCCRWWCTGWRSGFDGETDSALPACPDAAGRCSQPGAGGRRERGFRGDCQHSGEIQNS